MATIVRGTVPAEEFALARTLSVLPDAEVECERLIRSGDGAVMPLLWIRHVDRETLEEAFEADPTVSDVTCLSEFDDELLYRMNWVDHVDLLVQLLTKAEATILDAYGRQDRWQLRVLYPDRDHFTRTHEFAEAHGLTFDVESIREMEGEPAGRFGLTADQYEALVMAADRGFYSVPRETTMEELASDLDISHQALSERLRRGHEKLIANAMHLESSPV